MEKEIIFEEEYYSPDYQTTTYYFTTPVEVVEKLTGKKFPEAIHGTLSLEGEGMFPDAENISVMASPTKEVDYGTVDYDWYDIQLPNSEIESLLDIAYTAKGYWL